jgi:hypothetical protein
METKDINPVAEARFELKMVPNPETKTYHVEFKAANLPKDIANHLASHLNEGIAEFMECEGLSGTRSMGTRNVLTGEEKIVSTDKFGDVKPIDPKKVN